jgi:hypothetical protein
MATSISMYSMPFCSHSSRSLSLMCRDALLICVSPVQKRLKPPPVPEKPTITRTAPPVWAPNSSATASVMG